jgi:hypothetical protein
MQRRNFLNLLSGFSVSTALPIELFGNENTKKKHKPIVGSWFEFQHHSATEGKYWNSVLEKFTAADWDAKVKEIKAAGIQYLVLLDVAIYDKTFYPSKLMPQHELACPDPLEAVMTAADKYGVRFFISNDFFGNWQDPVFLMKDKAIGTLRMKAMNELAEMYGHHKSFYGWYYPNETGISGHYDDFFIDYVNESSAEALRLMPKAKTLIAPYGTRNVKEDATYVRQLEKLNVDFIAYQDEIGVEKTKVEESAAIFERLYRLHKKAAKSKLWADVEVFKFEGEVYKSALLPAPYERVVAQLEAVSPFVEKIFIYQYQGMLNKPGSTVFAGHTDSEKLHRKLFK